MSSTQAAAAAAGTAVGSAAGAATGLNVGAILTSLVGILASPGGLALLERIFVEHGMSADSIAAVKLMHAGDPTPEGGAK